MDNVEVIANGPLFNGHAIELVGAFIVEATDLVAKAAEEAVDRNLAASIRNPSSPPRYQSQINVARRGLDRVVNDNMIVYGPWLEGVGSRNATTRFKGYASFRRAQQQIDRDTPAIVAPALARLTAAVST